MRERVREGKSELFSFTMWLIFLLFTPRICQNDISSLCLSLHHISSFPLSIPPFLPTSLSCSLATSLHLPASLSLSVTHTDYTSEDHPDRNEEGAVKAMQLISMWETVTVHTGHVMLECKRAIQPFYHSPAHPDTHTLTHLLNLCAMSRHLQVYKTER